MVHLHCTCCFCFHNLPPQNPPLLRSGSPRVLPPDPCQLLLCTMDSSLVLSPWCSTISYPKSSSASLVHSNDTNILSWIEDLWTVDVWGTKEAIKSGQPFKSPLNCWEFCWGITWCIYGSKRRTYFLLCCGVGSLHCAVCNSISKTSNKWDPP